MNFNWHELDRDDFLSWMVVHLVAQESWDKSDGKFEQLRDITDGFSNVTMNIQINGVEVNVSHFVDSIQSVMKYQTERAAEDLAENMLDGVRGKMNAVEDVLEEVASDLREKVQAALY